MSDADLRSALDDLERLLAGILDHPDSGAVDAWHEAFRTALAKAERGPGWTELVQRAKDLGRRLDERLGQLKAIRGAVREELQARERGKRALKGYQSSSRV